MADADRKIVICNACRHEVKLGQRVIPTFLLNLTPTDTSVNSLTDMKYNHANCYDVDDDDPRYDENDQPITYQPKGYVKGRN